MARPKQLKAAPIAQTTNELIKQIEEACGPIIVGDKRFKYNSVLQLAIFAHGATEADDDTRRKMRLDAAKEVAKYTNIQIRAQEISGPGGGELKVRIINPGE